MRVRGMGFCEDSEPDMFPEKGWHFFTPDEQDAPPPRVAGFCAEGQRMARQVTQDAAQRWRPETD